MTYYMPDGSNMQLLWNEEKRIARLVLTRKDGSRCFTGRGKEYTFEIPTDERWLPRWMVKI